ncbi:nanos homolog 2-like [Chelmon rostratus]|uniref:nanos homolog 2-like n=1 Tax=Chelmon rostratus TaxID=109905 RepID=UPI001BEAA1D4|nr:nanos homolog 2-like [Chelmon rostratus]
MTTTQKGVGVQGALLSDGDCFDMWHDYMNLAGLLKELCASREGDHEDTLWPERDAAADPWGHIRTSGRKGCKNSAETSSLSDTSSSGTPSGFCRFCRQNGETARVYQSHQLKSDDGKVICPILWRYTCPVCEATGDHAHTRRYCPQAQRRKEAATELPMSGFW